MTSLSQELLNLLTDHADHEDEGIRRMVELTAMLVTEHAQVLGRELEAQRAYQRIVPYLA